MKPPLTHATPLLAALLWVAAILIDPGPFAPGSVLLIGVGLLEIASVAVIGMILTGGRWARWTAITGVTSTAVIAAARPIDPIWVVALVATSVAGAALSSGSITSGIRKLPAAAGPPERAVLVTVVLLGIPILLGMAAWDEPSTATLIVGLSAPIAALWYSRVLPGGLLSVRLLWPGLAIGLAITQGVAPGSASLIGGAIVAFLAWHPSVKVAFHPPRETGTAYPIPPELAPREILDAARLDEKGRPRT